MAWKIKLVTVACSLMILNPLDAARGVDRPLRNPQTVKDTSSMLQEMHGQMKLMQEQLGSLKASQQLLSAENAIKNLTPKVRKLEVHLERLEKQMASTLSTEELHVLKEDLADMKDKLQAVLSTPDTSVDAALSALNPTLDRMQKQVYYLYEAVKKQSDNHEKELNEKMSQVAYRLSEFEQDISAKISEIQGASSSLTLIRQALQHNYSLITNLKVELESLKNEKIGKVSQDFEALKKDFNKDEFLSKLSNLRQNVQKLAVVYKKSLASIEASSQLADKSLAQVSQVSLEVKQIGEAQTKQLSGLKVLYAKHKNLNEQIALIKTVLEQNQQSIAEKVKEELATHKLDTMKKGLVFLKKSNDKLVEQLAALKTQHDAVVSDNISFLQDVKAKMDMFPSMNEEIQKLNRKTLAIFHHVKNLAHKSTLDTISENLTLSIGRVDALNDTINQTKQDFQKDSKLIKMAAVKLSRGLKSNNEKVDALSTTVDQAKQDFASVISNFGQMQAQVTDLAQESRNFKEMIQKRDKVLKYCARICKDLKSGFELQGFKDQVLDLNTRVQALYEQKPFEIMVSSQTKIDGLEQEISILRKQLEEKDTLLSKLTRRVAFLTKTISQKMEQSPNDHSDLNQFKTSLEEKVNKELRAVQNDRMLFETLIQRVAALEASLNSEETLKEQ